MSHIIHIIGDSHANLSFKKIPNVKISYVGPITLKRVGNFEDEIIPKAIKEMNLSKDDILIFCFGEIDVRCHVHPILEHRKNATMYSILKDWVNNYISRISFLNLNGAKVVIMSVVPPSKKEVAESAKWPVTGSDEDRVAYTKRINAYLEEECVIKGWEYLNVYSAYADCTGMLPIEKSDKSVHIGDNTGIKQLLEKFVT